MRYRVTGGADGTAGIEVAEKRYEPGDEVDLPPSKASWLVEQGYLQPADAPKGSKKADEEVPVTVEETPAVAVESGEVF